MYRYILCVGLVCVFLNATTLKAQFVLNPSDGLPDLGRSTTLSADFNQDGRLDLVIMGVNSIGAKQTGIYFNNGDGTFSNSGAALIPLSDGALAVNDFNQDGRIDLLVTGVDAGNTKIARLYKNEGAGVFTPLELGLEGLSHGGLAFIDITNDGKPDLLLNGINNQNQQRTLVYINQGHEGFTLVPTSIVGTGLGDLLVFDMNNDSFLDVLVSGLNNNNQRVTKLYLNQGNALFVEQVTVLPALRSGGMAAGDVNNDGYTDVFISGSSSGSANHAAVYLNNAGSGFILFKTLPALSDGRAAWGDYNNDGHVDLVFFGFDKTDLQAFVFENTGGTDLLDLGFPLPGASQGSCIWFDYNNDRRLDFLLSGYSSVSFTSLYTNTTTLANTLPSAPANLRYTSYADSIVLSWDAPLDQETPSDGFTYALYIGSSSGAIDVCSPLANVSTGLRKVPGAGSVQHTSWVIHDLPEGIYYWSVQAIDLAFGASPFAVEQTFVSCSRVSIMGTDKVCVNSSLALEAGQSADQVEWYSKRTNNSLIGTGYQLDYALAFKDTITARVQKPLGCILYDSLIVDVFPLPLVDAGEDKSNCVDKEVNIEALTDATQVSWFEEGNDAALLASTKEIEIVLTRDVSLVVRVQDERSCINTDTVQVEVLPSPVVDIGDDQTACFDTELSWSTGTGSDMVSWFSQTQGLLLQQNFNFSMKIKEEDKLWAEVYNAEGCVSYDTINISVLALPLAEAGEDNMICNDQSVSIGTFVSEPSGLSFSWIPTASLSASDISNPVASPTEDTEYILYVRDGNNCENKDTVWVYLNRPSVINPGHDADLCIGDQLQLGGNPTASGSTLPYTFSWSPSLGLNNTSSANPTASPEVTTTYTLTTMAGNCLVDVSALTITVNPLPDVQAGEDFVVGATEPATLSVTGASEYQWFPQEFFMDETSVHPVVFPNRTTRFWVRGKDLNGCYNTDTVQVTVRSELFVPSLFTPNGDDVNNIFRAHGFGIKEIKLKVYDRWGRLLFESNDLEKGWDGHMNGTPVEPGNYVWTVEGRFMDDSPLQYQGQQRGMIKLLR